MLDLKPIKGPVMVFANLNIACFDAPNGEQIPELQESLPTLFAKHAERNGWDADGVIIETADGNWRLRRTENGWNRDPA